MGFTVETLTAYNPEDMIRAERGEIQLNEVRRVTVRALVDTGCFWCGLHRREIELLGLTGGVEASIKTGNGFATFRRFTPGPVLEIQGRRSSGDVIEVPDDLPAIIGVGLLEALLFVVDPVSQRLIQDPQRPTHWFLFGQGAA